MVAKGLCGLHLWGQTFGDWDGDHGLGATKGSPRSWGGRLVHQEARQVLGLHKKNPKEQRGYGFGDPGTSLGLRGLSSSRPHSRGQGGSNLVLIIHEITQKKLKLTQRRAARGLHLFLPDLAEGFIYKLLLSGGGGGRLRNQKVKK